MSIFSNFVNTGRYVSSLAAHYSNAAYQATPPVRQMAMNAASTVTQPIYNMLHKGAVQAGNALANPIIANLQLNERLDQVSADASIFLDDAKQFLGLLGGTIQTGAYLVTAIAGAHLYQHAMAGAKAGDLFCQAQQIAGVAMAVIAGGCWLYRLSKQYLHPAPKPISPEIHKLLSVVICDPQGDVSRSNASRQACRESLQNFSQLPPQESDID